MATRLLPKLAYIYVETTFQVVCDFSNIRHMIVLDGLCVLFGELELDLVGETELDKEVHNLAILLILEEVIRKHLHTTGHQQFSTTLVLVNGSNRSVAGICKGPRCQYTV